MTRDPAAPGDVYTHEKMISGVLRRRQLDHCFVSSELKPRVRSVHAANGEVASDHHPLWMNIDLESSASGFLTVFLAVIAAAAMHAAWNALVKVRTDRFASISITALGMALVAMPVAALRGCSPCSGLAVDHRVGHHPCGLQALPDHGL